MILFFQFIQKIYLSILLKINKFQYQLNRQKFNSYINIIITFINKEKLFMYYKNEKEMKNNYHLKRPNKNNTNNNQVYSQSIKLEPPRSFSQWKINNNNNQQYRAVEQERPRSIASNQSNGKPLKNSRLSDYIAQQAKNLIQQRQPYQYQNISSSYLVKKHDRCKSLYDEYQYKTGTSQPHSFHYNPNINVNYKTKNNHQNQQMCQQHQDAILYEIPSFGLDARSHHSQSKNNLAKASSHSLFTTLKERNSFTDQYPASHKLQPVYQKQSQAAQNFMKHSALKHSSQKNKQIHSKKYQVDSQNCNPYMSSQQKLKRSIKSLPKQTLLTANLNVSRRNSNHHERKYQIKELDNQRIQNMNQINTKIQNILFALEQQSSHQEQFNRRYSAEKNQISKQSPIHSHYNSKHFQSSWQNPFGSNNKKQQNFNQQPQRQTLSALIPNLCQTYNYDNSYQTNQINQTVNQFQLGSRYFNNNNDNSFIKDSRSRQEQNNYLHNERYTFGVESRYAQNKGNGNHHSQNIYQANNYYGDHIKQDDYPKKQKEIYPDSDLKKSVQNIRKRRQYQKSQQKDKEQQFAHRKSVFDDIKKSYLYSRKGYNNEKDIQNISPKKSNRNKRCQTEIDQRSFDNQRYEQLTEKYAFNKKSLQKSQNLLLSNKKQEIKNKIITNLRQNTYQNQPQSQLQLQTNEKSYINSINCNQPENKLKRQYSAKSMGHTTNSFNRLKTKQNQNDKFSQYEDKTSLIVKGKNVNDQIAKIQKKIQCFEQMKKQLNIQSVPVSDRSKSPRSRQCSPRLTNLKQKTPMLKLRQNFNNDQNKNIYNPPAQRVKTQSDAQLLKIRETYSRQKQEKKSPINKNQPLRQFSSYFGASNQKILEQKNQNIQNQKPQIESQVFMGKQNITSQVQKQLQKAKYVEYEEVSTPRLLRNLKSRQQNKLKKQKKFKSQFMKDLNSFDRLTGQEDQYRNGTQRSENGQTPKVSENRQVLSSLLNKLQTQISIDQNFRNLKKWFNSIISQQKWYKLSQTLSEMKVKLSQNQIEEIFFLTQEQNNPFFSTRGQQSSYSDLVKSYLQSESNWKQIKKALSHNQIKQLQQAGFNKKSLDIDRKGFISIEDLTRFLNLQMNQYYRNRDIVLIWRRMNQFSLKQQENEHCQRINFEDMMKALLKETY